LGKLFAPIAGWMTYSHLQADCLYTGISLVMSTGNFYLLVVTQESCTE